MCYCNCNKENKYFVRYKWKETTSGIEFEKEDTEFVTTDDIESWWNDFKDEGDLLVSIDKL